VFTLFFSSLILYRMGVPILTLIITTPWIAAISSMIALILLFFYPVQKAGARKKSIESNLPFAATHMSAIASSGLPPSTIFRMLTGFEEYGEIARDARTIVRNMDVFGQDVTTAIEQIASQNPSEKWKELLLGIVATVDTGGNLQEYLNGEAEDAMNDYRLRREKYMESLSTYADFYTGVLIAGPLFLVSILAVMNLIGGTIGGLGLTMTCAAGVAPSLLNLLRGYCAIGAMEIGIYIIIPLANIAFLMFIHATQPEVF
jgi:flagellar protein FlaJ